MIIVLHQSPLWWLFFVLSKKCVIFVVLCTWCGHYILKVFSLSYKKMWKFSRTRDERITLTICLFMAGNALVFRCVLSPYHSGVGISIVYFLFGFFHNLLVDKREPASHFLFVYIHTPVVKKEYAENP